MNAVVPFPPPIFIHTVKNLPKRLPSDDKERSLLTELEGCTRRLAIANDELTNPAKSMLMDEYNRREHAIKAISAECDAPLAVLREYRKSRSKS